jgi:hypothetical protein
MEPHWVNARERLPEDGREVYVLVASCVGDDIEYARARRSNARWVFAAKPLYPETVAWIEPCDISLSDDELSRIPKDEIRFWLSASR